MRVWYAMDTRKHVPAENLNDCRGGLIERIELLLAATHPAPFGSFPGGGA